MQKMTIEEGKVDTGAADNTEQQADTEAASTTAADASQAEDTTQQVETGEGAEAGKAEGGADDEGKKPEGSENEAGKDKEGEGNEPIEYGEFTFPEGFQADRQMQEAVLPLLAKAGVNQEAAQELINAHCEAQRAQLAQAQAQQQATLEAWRNQIESDPEYEAKQGWAEKGKERLLKDIPDAKDFFEDAVLGNMPMVFQLTAHLGKMLESEASLLNGDKGGSEKKSFADVLYSDM
jgi:hypothetical protein